MCRWILTPCASQQRLGDLFPPRGSCCSGSWRSSKQLTPRLPSRLRRSMSRTRESQGRSRGMPSQRRRVEAERQANACVGSATDSLVQQPRTAESWSRCFMVGFFQDVRSVCRCGAKCGGRAMAGRPAYRRARIQQRVREGRSVERGVVAAIHRVRAACRTGRPRKPLATRHRYQ
jgi:hypothetical protein